MNKWHLFLKSPIIDSVEAGICFEYDPTDPLPPHLISIRDEFDSAETERKAMHVFACCGLALYKSQCLEVQLRTTLVWLKIASKQVQSLEEWDSADQQASKDTLGKLLRQFRSVLRLNQAGLDLLDKALEARNDLAHHFYYRNASAFCDEAGQPVMVNQLLKYVHLFACADLLMEAVQNVLLKVFKVPRGWFDRAVREIMEKDMEKREEGSGATNGST